jgi:hypothetical protein
MLGVLILPAAQDEVVYKLTVLASALSQYGAQLTVTCSELEGVQCSGAGVKQHHVSCSDHRASAEI